MKVRSMKEPDHAQVRRFYDNEYYADTDAESRLPWHVRNVASRLGNLGGAAVLDIACGSGQWLEELQRRGANVSGIDISSRAVELARARLPHADIREGVAETLPFGDKVFELVTCMGSLEHFLDQPGALQEMRRVATDSARFLILVPNAGFLTRRLGMYRGTGQLAIRETVRPLAEWVELIEGAGLAVDACWRDLHTLSTGWIRKGPWYGWPLRAAQAAALAFWPVAWQYQVYFFCKVKRDPKNQASDPAGPA